MNKISFAILTAALVLLSGCNKENSAINSAEDLFIESETDIRFIKLGGMASATTRASIESFDEMIDPMGVFCLAARKTDIKSASQAKDIDWSQIVSSNEEQYGTTTNGVYWGNVCCDVSNNSGYYTIEPTQGSSCYDYYPMTSWFGYDFYGYHPYQNDYTPMADSVFVDITIDGTQDVIWGKSETPDFAALTDNAELQEKLAKCYYSARYFRNHPKNIEDTHLKFEHLLTRFQFFVYPGADKENASDKQYDEAAALCIKEICLNQVENNLRLIVADRSDNNRSGILYSRDERASDGSKFYLHHKDGAELAERPVNIPTKTDESGTLIPDTVKVGDCIMALPGHTAYYMSVVLADTANYDKTYASEKNITIALNAEHTRKFEAGKIYNVYLRVTGVTKIGITAELEGWEESEEELDIIAFN